MNGISERTATRLGIIYGKGSDIDTTGDMLEHQSPLYVCKRYTATCLIIELSVEVAICCWLFGQTFVGSPFKMDCTRLTVINFPGPLAP